MAERLERLAQGADRAGDERVDADDLARRPRRPRCTIVVRAMSRSMTRFARLAALPMLFAGMARAAAPSVPILEPDALKPGQKAEVRTVFAGDRIETFDAEILGVLKGGKVEGDVILARATSDRVTKTGIAQGMSGSPVYVDGKLVGAL